MQEMGPKRKELVFQDVFLFVAQEMFRNFKIYVDVKATFGVQCSFGFPVSMGIEVSTKPLRFHGDAS